MRYFALATDFDGTMAHDGIVPRQTLEDLKALRKTGRSIIVVTGRLVSDLRREFPDVDDVCDLIVAENGAVLCDPARHEELQLGPTPPARFVEELRRRGVTPLEVGASIVATREPQEKVVLETIRDLSLELQVIFNKGTVMVLSSGVNKATGLAAALDRLGLSAHNVVGVGDAENDHALLRSCECGAAVANALPSVKDDADLVLKGDHGAGVSELVARLIATDLEELGATLQRRQVQLGTAQGHPVSIDPYLRGTLLLAGGSGSGKSTVALALLERLIGAGYQTAIVDPEGEYEPFSGAIVVGNAQAPPALDEVDALLAKPGQSAIVNLLGVAQDDRTEFAATLLPRIQALRARLGRPHWVAMTKPTTSSRSAANAARSSPTTSTE